MDRSRQRATYRKLSDHPALRKGSNRTSAPTPTPSPSSSPAASAPQLPHTPKPQSPIGERLYREAVSRRATVFALIDAAACPDAVAVLEKYDGQSESLFEGRNASALKGVAPYLVEFRPHSSFSQWWFDQWGKHAGVLIESPTTLHRLRTHLRTLTIVRDESGGQFFFRFYDPRVLRVFLPECDEAEAQRFFGPASAYYCEGESEETLLAFRLEADKLTQRTYTAPAH